MVNDTLGKSKSSLEIFLGILIFALTEPYFLWHIGVVYSILLIFGFLCMVKYTDIYINSTICLYVCVFGFLCYASGNSITTFIRFLCFIPFFFINGRILKNAYKVFCNIYIVFLILSLFTFVLYNVGVKFSGIVVEPLNTMKDYDYVTYIFLVVPNKFQMVDRYHFLFEEPGNVGTYAILILGIEKFKINNWKNILIVISGLLSLSLFFYVSLVFVLIANVISGSINTRYKVLLTMSIAVIIGLANIEGNIVYDTIGARLQYDSERETFAGNNRAREGLVSYYDKIRWSTETFYWGSTISNENKQMIADLSGGSAGYRNAIINYGLVGFVLYVLFYVKYSGSIFIDKRNRLFFLCIFIFMLFQRPFFTNSIFFILYLIWIRSDTFDLAYNHNSVIEVSK